MKLAMLNLCLCFVLAVVVSPFMIKWLRKLKFGQNILVYVEQHKGKTGTPTMGGIIFICTSIVGYFVFFNKNNTFATISILSLLFFGVLGFLDDFIKIKLKHNEGLKPYQKVIGQFGISLIVAIYIYMSDMVGDVIRLPFSNIEWEIGFWIVPFVVVFFIAVVNSVNLIDGLDGLCAGVSSIVILVFTIILMVISKGIEGVLLFESNNLIVVSFGVAGAVLGFLCFNSFPAKVFMGDTGSLALGGFIASSFALTGQYLLIMIVGVAYLVTSLSVILQVGCFKMFRKRIFKMSPLHHHFEASVNESKVTSVYILLTIVIGVLSICLYL